MSTATKAGTMPSNIEAESSVLGSILIDPEVMGVLAEYLLPEDFYRDSHRLIFQSALNLYEQGKVADYVTLTDDLEQKGLLEDVGGSSYLTQLVNYVPTSANATYYGDIVVRLAKRRQMIQAGGQIVSIAYNEPDDGAALSEAEKLIYEIGQDRNTASDLEPVEKPIGRFIKELDTIIERKEAGFTLGCPLGFKDLDRLLGGMEAGNLLILAARPSMGKTSFCLSIAYNAAISSQKNVAIFSLEMSKEQLVQRLLSMESRVDLQKIRSGSLADDEWQRLNYSMGVLSEAPLFLDDTAVISLPQVRRKCRRLKAEQGLDLIIIDYLQLMSSSGPRERSSRGYENRVQEVSEISRGLKTLAKELDVPVLALSQLSRAVESRQVRTPLLSDLRESGSIEQDADVVMFIYREDVYNPETERRNVADVIVAKHRNGPTGQAELFFRKENTRFYDMALS